MNSSVSILLLPAATLSSDYLFYMRRTPIDKLIERISCDTQLQRLSNLYYRSHQYVEHMLTFPTSFNTPFFVGLRRFTYG